MEFRIHWLSITIWQDSDFAFALWDTWFGQTFGHLNALGHGARLFAEVHKALLGTKIYVKPLRKDDDYFHLEIPGKACEALEPLELMQFIKDLVAHEKFKVKRLDLAWDGVPFTPKDIYDAVFEDKARTYAKRETLHFHSEPFAEREDGETGTSSTTLGKRSSHRSMRVYDLHGPVRLEIETRRDRADLIARDLLIRHPDEWPEVAIGHLRDFIDVDTNAWNDFIKGKARAGAKLVNAREVELSRITEWLLNQVSPALSVVVDVVGEDVPKAMVIQGRRVRNGKYKSLLDTKRDMGNAKT